VIPTEYHSQARTRCRPRNVQLTQDSVTLPGYVEEFVKALVITLSLMLASASLLAFEKSQDTDDAGGEAHASVKVRTMPDDLEGEELQAVEIFQRIQPTVVTIFVSEDIETQHGSSSREGLGAGVLVAPACQVLTAAHVVEGADEILVKTADGQLRPAEVVFSQDRADIALLKLKVFDPDLPHAVLGDSDRLAVGQRAFVVGSPAGLENSFSVGHISGFRGLDRLYDGTILVEHIQIDAAINSGNSGGPVFDSKGTVIGIASRILSHSGGFEGLGFVVAINTAKQLLAQEDHPWIGIEGMFLNSDGLAQILNHDLEGGLLVLSVVKGSPAERAGLKGGRFSADIFGRNVMLGGDLIIEFNGQETCHSACLMEVGEQLGSADTIPVTFMRGGVIRHATIDVSGHRRNLID
jgi:serine protease Do